MQSGQQIFFKSILFAGFKCQNCRYLRLFLRVKFGLKVLLLVKEFTFRNSVDAVDVTTDSFRCFHNVKPINPFIRLQVFYEKCMRHVIARQERIHFLVASHGILT